MTPSTFKTELIRLSLIKKSSVVGQHGNPVYVLYINDQLVSLLSDVYNCTFTTDDIIRAAEKSGKVLITIPRGHRTKSTGRTRPKGVSVYRCAISTKDLVGYLDGLMTNLF